MAVNFTRPKADEPTMELTPMIDVIFQLLIFFMISSSFLYPSLQIQLPKVDDKGNVQSNQHLIVSISPEGEYFINNNLVNKEELEHSLREELSELDQKSVFFRADETVPYKQVVDIMKMANSAGALQFNFIYEGEKSARIDWYL